MGNGTNNIQQTKENLDKLNYGKALKNRKKDDLELINTDYNIGKEHIVYKSFDKLSEKLKKPISNVQYHIGVISTGSHTLDYAKYYGFTLGDDWHYEPVMYVYECPADNCKYSFTNTADQSNGFGQYKGEVAKNAYRIFINDPIQDFEEIKNHLCRCLWHVDDAESNEGNKKCGEGEFSYFESKSYGRFMHSLIREFKLANFYTTNMFRYEVFKEHNRKGNEKETALNLTDMAKEILGKTENQIKGWKWVTPDCRYLKVFIKEINILKPEVIFATSNPYSILQNWKNMKHNEIKDEWKELYENLKNATLVKLPHPANRDSCAERYLKNTINTIKGLKVAGIIKDEDEDKDEEQLVMNAYKKYTAFDDIFPKIKV